jgi:hypothetical protein
VWANSAYSGEHFKQLLRAAAVEQNSIWSEIRTLVAHVFGCFATLMGGQFTKKIGLKRNNAWWSLKNLTLYFLRYLHNSSNLLASI